MRVLLTSQTRRNGCDSPCIDGHLKALNGVNYNPVSGRAYRRIGAFSCKRNSHSNVRVPFLGASWPQIIGRQITLQRVKFTSTDQASDWQDSVVESIDDETAGLLEKYLATFRTADADEDGLLRREELRSLLERVSGGEESVPLHWLTDDDLNEIFDQYDRDEDGAISFREFTKLAHDNVFLTKELNEYRAAFNAVDVGGDGFIGPNEMCSILTALDSPLKSYDQITRLMAKYDTDRSGRIDFGEFLRLCRYEKALPIDQILHYASTLAAARSAQDGTSSSSSGSSADVEPVEYKNHRVLCVNSESMFQGILDVNKNKLVVLLASLTWCRPCKRIAPVFQKLAEAYPSVVFIRLNGNDSDETKRLFKKKLKIRATPSFLFFRQGDVVGSCIGANPSRVESTLRSFLSETDDKPEHTLYEIEPVVDDANGDPQ